MIWVLLGICLVGPLLLWRVPLCAVAGSVEAGPLLKVSIIVPARNEEENLRVLLASVAALDPAPFEVLVVDDSSSDGTAEVATRLGARVLKAPPLPDGWRGKAWACRHGAEAARGNAFLFLDADTKLSADALARMQSSMLEYQCEALSLAPYHRPQFVYEQFSAVFNILTAIGVGAFGAWNCPDAPHGLFGPVLLIKSGAYRAAGGHGAVKGEILEHMSLAPVLRKHGIHHCVLGGRGVVEIRMYPHGMTSLVEGWSKAFAAGANKTAPATLALSVTWISGAMATATLCLLSLLLAGVPLSVWIAYGAYAVSVAFMLRIGSFSPWTSLLYPLPLLAFFFIFVKSFVARRRGYGATWKGRTVGENTQRGPAP